MMKLGTETGSLLNHIMSRYGDEQEVKVGDPCTILHWSDRTPATIIKVTPKTVTVQEDKYKRIDKNGMSDCQEYEYERDPNGSTKTFRLTKRGWTGKGGHPSLSIGYRERYYDYSF